MSLTAVIVLVVVAALMLAMLIAGARKASQARPHRPEEQPYRSHAEASRGRE